MVCCEGRKGVNDCEVDGCEGIIVHVFEGSLIKKGIVKMPTRVFVTDCILGHKFEDFVEGSSYFLFVLRSQFFFRN